MNTCGFFAQEDAPSAETPDSEQRARAKFLLNSTLSHHFTAQRTSRTLKPLVSENTFLKYFHFQIEVFPLCHQTLLAFHFSAAAPDELRIRARPGIEDG